MFIDVLYAQITLPFVSFLGFFSNRSERKSIWLFLCIKHGYWKVQTFTLWNSEIALRKTFIWMKLFVCMYVWLLILMGHCVILDGTPAGCIVLSLRSFTNVSTICSQSCVFKISYHKFFKCLSFTVINMSMRTTANSFVTASLIIPFYILTLYWKITLNWLKHEKI